mgnify:CR=1 FL=1|jgi:hypothetical protein
MTQIRRLTEGDGIALLESVVQQRLTVHVRRDVVAFLADLGDGSRVDRGAGVVAFNSGLTYPAGSVGAAIKDILSGIGEGGAWGDVDALLAALNERIGPSQLTLDLLDKINRIGDGTEEIEDLIDDAVAVERNARIAAIAAEAQARAEGFAAEAAARTDAIELEALNRIAQIEDETALRTIAINAEAAARAQALLDEAAARNLALANEGIARAAAIASEANTRADADLVLAYERQSLTAAVAGAAGAGYAVFHQAPPFPAGTRIGDVAAWKNAAGVETFQRWNGSTWVDSLANKRAAIFRGTYANNGALPGTGNVIGDTARRQSDNTVMVWNGSGWTAVSSALAVAWAFIDREAEARVAADASEATTRAALATQMRGGYTGNSLAALTEGLLYDERQARSTADATEVTARQALSTKVTGAADPASLTLGTLTAGLLYDERQARSTADATEVTARQSLSTKITGVVDPSSLTLATLTSGLIYDERQARSTAVASEASARTTLATQMRGDYTGSSLAALTSGLLFEERQARSSADATEVTARQSLSTKITGAADPSSLTLATLTSGLIYDERQARSTAVASEASSRAALATQMRGAYTGSNLAGLTEGLLYDERQARSTADASEVTARQALSTKVTGATDPASLTLATLSAGLLFDERQARSTADSTEVTLRQALSTKITGLADPSSATLASLTSGLIFEERQARSSAIASEVSARTDLQARFENPTVGNNPTYAAVVTEASARAAADGALAAQWVLKVAGTRSDGKKVFATIGLAATADNHGGESQILLAADKLLFVPEGNINATPANMLEVGLVNGVTTLRVPAARIGDATITPGKMSVPNLSAITANVGTLTAGVIRNAADSYRLDVTEGREIVRSGGFMKVTGAPFGASSQFIEWYGPNQANLANCTEANALYYLKTNGAAYFGGTLSAGVLQNAAHTTSTTVPAEVVVGPFLTNGGTKSIVLSYSYFYRYACAAGTGSISGAAGSATIVLERSIDGGAWVQIGTLTANETVRTVITDDPDTVIYSLAGSTTVSDNSAATSNMRLRARLTVRSLPTFGGSGSFSILETQDVGVASTEQP